VRKFIVIAILALIGSTAAAEAKVHQFKFGGRVVRFEVPKNCKKISCIQANVKEKSSKAGKSESVAATAVPAAAAPVAAAAVDSPKATTPAPSAAPAAPASQATEADDRKPLARLSLPVTDEPKPVVRATEPAIRATEPVAAAEPVKPAEPSPLGVWATEKNEGKVRIVECGEALCGHTEGKPGEKILINMQSGQKNRWNGKINDVRSGGTYTSHMSMKGANALRVEGCAFGGLFCGGQTWTRVE